MTEWIPIKEYRKKLHGKEVIGLGLSPLAKANNNGETPDTRIIRKSYLGGWQAKNDYGWFTVGFHPEFFIPMPAGGK